VRERSESSYDVTAAATSGSAAAVRSLVVRLRGNESLMAEILSKTNWDQLQELLK
jgi:hypothetical protein